MTLYDIKWLHAVRESKSKMVHCYIGEVILEKIVAPVGGLVKFGLGI